MAPLRLNDFQDQSTLTGETLSLWPLRAEDIPELTAAAADERTWAGHPTPDRCKPEVFRPYAEWLLRAGGTLVVALRATGALIGCSRYYPVPDQPDGIGIGFTFLNAAYWGGAANWELKTLMLEHAFAQVPTVWFHIAPTNIRSQKATAKLGAVHAYDATLTLAETPIAWTCWRLDRQAWEAARANRPAVEA